MGGTLILLRFDDRFWFQIRLMAFGDAFRNLVTAKSGLREIHPQRSHF